MKKLWSARSSELGAKVSPQLFFVLSAAIFGLIFIAIIPPFEAPDEPVHFFRAYQISEGNLSVDKVGSVYGGRLPTSLRQTIYETYDRSGVSFHPDIKYNIHDTRQAFSVKNTSERATYDFSTTAYYSPVSYIPQAIGIGIGRLFNMPPIIMLYLGRLCNLAAWITLFYLAVRFMPYKKWAIVFIGLLPMALAQAASLSADIMAIGLLALTLALILKLEKSTARLSSKQIGVLVVILTALALSKQIMFLFVALVLLLPQRLFNSSRAAWATKALLILIPVTGFAIWSFHVRSIPFSTSVHGINPHGQEHYILNNPYDYANNLVNTYFYSWSDGIVKSFMGNFGWVDTPLADTIVVPGYIALFLIMVANSTQKRLIWLNSRQKALIGGLALIYILGVSTALYAYSTPVGFKIVVGLVGRYYLPVVLLLVPIVASNWLQITQKAYRRIAIWAPIFLLVCSTITIYVRYYINNV